MKNGKALGAQTIYLYLNRRNIAVGSVWKNSGHTYGIKLNKKNIPKHMWPVEFYGLNGEWDYTGIAILYCFGCRSV